MPRIDPELQRLQEIKTLPSLIKYLKDDLNWPIGSDDVESVVFDYDPAELGFDSASTAKIEEVCQLRPLTPGQKWGVFWVKFGKKQLPVQMLRRALGNLVVKKRTSTKKADKAAWHMHDLLFISAYGDDSNRHITFAHFSESEDSEKTLPVLKVLGWDEDDTLLHLKDTYKTLLTTLNWETTPVDNPEAWREHWSSAFKLGHREVINTTKELVVKLAQLATVIKKSVLTSIKAETDKGPWKKLMLAFQKTLIKDLDEDQFADVIAQTVSYGLLTARLSSDGPISLKNLVDMVPSTNPFLKELLQHFLTSSGMRGLFDVDEAGINDVVELLNRADAQAIRNDFGKKTDGQDPVIHFYEHFLGAYNKKLKVERGVFYTPQPIVSYIVRSVHILLQKEFGLEDGLADTSTWADVKKLHKDLKTPEGINPDLEPFVQILDPATGTATFLIEVIDVIHSTMTAKWDKERVTNADQIKKWNTYVPTHLLPRLYAYELMMAPYAIAHMKVGLKLTETGFTAWDKIDKENRANIFLTNALETWAKQLPLIGFDALAREAAAVNKVKRNTRFTVVIGNPPYAGHSVNNHIPEIVDLVRDYKAGLPELDRPGQGKWLQDDYVKFIRLGEHILESVPIGLLGYITNHSFLDNPTFKGMRRHLLSSFPRISLTDLHGNTKKKERAEDGTADENVFAIQQGVAIMVGRRGSINPTVMAHDLTGTREEKYSWLATHSAYGVGVNIHPTSPMCLFRAQDSTLLMEYGMGVPLPDLMSQNGEPAPGFVTTHDEFAISWTASEAAEKVELLLATKSEDEARNIFTLCSQNQWNYARAKTALKDGAWRKHVVEVLYRPFDWRWTVWNQNVAVHRRERVMRHMLERDNLGLICTRQTKDQWGVLATRNVTAHKTCGAYDINFLFPVYLLPESDELSLIEADIRTNFAPSFARRLGDALGLQLHKQTGLPTGLTPEDIFHYTYAVFHSPNYRSRYAEFLKIDFPRLPLTESLALFRKLAKIGDELTALHLLESPKLAKFLTEFTGGRAPEVEKATWSKNTVWIDKAQTIGFKGAKEEVWNFHIGGYQVCEKWLKDRKGRKLSKEDVIHYQKIVVAISETIRLMAEIDKVIDEHGGWPGAFQAAK